MYAYSPGGISMHRYPSMYAYSWAGICIHCTILGGIAIPILCNSRRNCNYNSLQFQAELEFAFFGIPGGIAIRILWNSKLQSFAILIRKAAEFQIAKLCNSRRNSNSHSGYIQETFRIRIQGTFRLHSGNIQNSNSANIQETFRKHSGRPKAGRGWVTGFKHYE